MAAATRPQPVRRPSVLLLAAEGPRAAGELAWLRASRPLLARAPRGDGHHVLVLPGLTADDRSTRTLRAFLRDLGYHVHGWRLGANVPTRDLRRRLGRRLARLRADDPRPLSIIGWSLGGMYAREIARAVPEAVRLVITLGSPFRTAPGHESHPQALIRALVGPVAIEAPTPLPGGVDDRELPVPSTAVLTRTDGVVPWQACVDTPVGPHETLEVVGSHCGLGHHPAVLWIAADRLAQPEGHWEPLRVPLAWRGAIRPRPGR